MTDGLTKVFGIHKANSPEERARVLLASYIILDDDSPIPPKTELSRVQPWLKRFAEATAATIRQAEADAYSAGKATT